MKFLLLFSLLISNTLLVIAQRLNYPVSEKIPQSETYFNKFQVKDDYRWLEDINGKKVRSWIKEQNELAMPILQKAQTKHNTNLLIDKYSFYKFSHPNKKGRYYFSLGYLDKNATPALLYKESLHVHDKLLVDPNLIDISDRIDIRNYEVSKNSELLAFQYSRNGSDWNEIKVITLKNGAFKKDHLKNVKFSNIAWKGDGFFYNGYSPSENLGRTSAQKIYFHQVGTEQSEDKIVFERNDPSLNFQFQTTSDERYLIIKEINQKAGKSNIFFTDYQEAQPALKPLLTNLKYTLNILDSHDGKLIATSHNDNTGSILEIDPANPLKWKNLSPGFSKAVLLDVLPLQDKIIATYQTNQRPLVTVYDYSGAILYNLELPLGTSVSSFTGNYSDEEFLFHLSSYIFPPIVYSFNIKNYERKVTDQTRINYSADDLEVIDEEATGKDGTKIPLLVVQKRGLVRNGNNPTVLSAYGGFGAVASPHFDPGIVYFVKQGGVFVFANIRGGGDLGVSWANAGHGSKKQTSFDDFISAAEFLIREKYTNAGKLATTGGSNGGLVVAAAAIQRPELFKAVVPVVAPLDMIRFEEFTAGKFWTKEYGTVADSSSFKRLYKFSPYHNIQETVNYPAMLIMTSENDDRVVPLHSYKFAAKLQNRPAQKNPILLRTEKFAGHYGAATISSEVQEKANMYAFIWEMLNQ